MNKNKERIKKLLDDPQFNLYVLSIATEIYMKQDIKLEEIYAHFMALAEVSMEYVTGELK